MSSQYDQIVKAAELGDEKLLNDILCNTNKDEASARINSAAFDKATPLTLAAKNGHLNMVKLLVERFEADLHRKAAVQLFGKTVQAPPLVCAAASGCPDLIEYLISKGAEINCTTANKSTPLMYACMKGSVDTVNLLFKVRSDKDYLNRWKNNAVMIASLEGHTEVVKLFVDAEVDLDRQNINGKTALHHAVDNQHMEIIKILLDGGADILPDKHGITPLMEAAADGEREICECIYKKRKSVITMVEVLGAMEVLGAGCIIKTGDLAEASDLWEMALRIRESDETLELQKPNTAAFVTNCCGVEEVNTLSDLVDIKKSALKMNQQAVSVLENNVGPVCQIEPRYHRHVFGTLWEIGIDYLPHHNYNSVYKIWNYCLEMLVKTVDPLEKEIVLGFERMSILMAMLAIDGNEDMIELERANEKNKDSIRLETEISFENVASVFGKAVREIERGQELLADVLRPRLPEDEEVYLERFNEVVVAIVTMLSSSCQLLHTASEKHEAAFRSDVKKLIELNPRGPMDMTVLQLVSSEITSLLMKEKALKFPCINSISLLTAMGAAS